MKDLSTEAVQGAALSLESIDHVHGRHGLAAGVLSVGDSIADDVLEEHLEDTAGLLIDQAGNTLDTTTASQTPDSGLGDALNVVAEHLAVSLGAALAQTLATFATARHLQDPSVGVRLGGIAKVESPKTSERTMEVPKALARESLTSWIGFKEIRAKPKSVSFFESQAFLSSSRKFCLVQR